MGRRLLKKPRWRLAEKGRRMFCRCQRERRQALLAAKLLVIERSFAIRRRFICWRRNSFLLRKTGLISSLSHKGLGKSQSHLFWSSTRILRCASKGASFDIFSLLYSFRSFRAAEDIEAVSIKTPACLHPSRTCCCQALEGEGRAD